MIASWNASQYGEQDSNDMWGLIQDEVANGWFVPSKSEWSAFGATFDITSSNYSNTYGLSVSNWTSSQNDSTFVFRIHWYNSSIATGTTASRTLIRLATTF